MAIFVKGEVQGRISLGLCRECFAETGSKIRLKSLMCYYILRDIYWEQHLLVAMVFSLAWGKS